MSALTETKAKAPAERVRQLKARAQIWDAELRRNLDQQRAVRIGLEAAGGDWEILEPLERCKRRLEAEHKQLTSEREDLSIAIIAAGLDQKLGTHLSH